jgi:hypothetical protein
MKRITSYVAFICLLAIGFNTSCTKENELSEVIDSETQSKLSEPEAVSTKNGILVFESRNDMYNYLNDVETNEALSHKESILGFQSLYSICEKAFAKDEELWESYETLDYTREEFLAAFESGELAKYSKATLELINNNKLKITEDEEEIVEYTTSAPYLAKVLNENNLVCVNDTIFQYNEHSIKFIPNGDFSLIEKLESVNDNDKKTGIIIAKERKFKDTYYPTTIINCAYGEDQSGTSYNSKRLKGYLRIKHFDYITSTGLPWYYHAYYIHAYTYVHRWNFGWYWKPKGASVNLASCYWSFHHIWQGNSGVTHNSFISSTISTSNAGGTKLLYEGYSDPTNISYSAFSGSVIMQRIDSPSVMFTLAHSKVEVPSRWF